jgi:LacI family transcriptional regulator, galactose operon repressor
VALIGVGEFALADKRTPFVTVVVHNPPVIGAAAAQLLFTRVNGDTSSPCDVLLLTHLAVPGPGEITPTVTRALLSPLSHYLLLDYTLAYSGVR